MSMLDSVYNVLLRRRRIIFFAIIIGVVAGIMSLRELTIKLYPDIDKPVIEVYIQHPSYTAVDFADMYGDTIRTTAAAIDGVVESETTISNRRSTVKISFDYGLNGEEMSKRVESAFNGIKNSLPEESRDFSIGYYSSTVNELDIALYSTEIDERALYDIAKPVVLEHISKLQDAENVNVFSIEDLTAELVLDPDALFSYGLTADSVVNAIRSSAKNISVGSLRTPIDTMSLRIKTDTETVFDIGEIVVGVSGGSGMDGAKVVRVADIADVNIEYRPSWGFRVNGERAVTVYIQPKQNSNLSRLSTETKKALDAAMEELPDHINYEIVLDPATFINNSVSNVVSSGLIGILLAVFCIILLIGDPRNSIIIATSIPLSIVMSFTLMYLFDVSINLISLSGLALATGMVVDASIVVTENIYRLRENKLIQKGFVKNYIKLISRSSEEVVPSIVGSTITSVCVFIPLSFTSPLTASILGDLAKTVVFSLVSSLLVAMFAVPVLAFYLFRDTGTEESPIKKRRRPPLLKRVSSAIVDSLIRVYRKALNSLLRSKAASIIFVAASVAALVLCVVFLLPKITREIIAAPQGNILTFSMMNYDISDQEEIVAAAVPIESDLLTNYGSTVKQVFTQINRNFATLLVTLDKASNMSAMIDTLSSKYQSDGAWYYGVGSWDPSAMPLPETWGLHIRVEGPNRSQIFALEDKIVDIIRKSDLFGGTRNVPSTSFTTELSMRPRDEAFSTIPEYAKSRLASMVQTMLNGVTAVTLKTDDDEINVKLRYPEKFASSSEDIGNFQLPLKGKAIPLKHFFDFEQTSGITQLYFNDDKETYNIYASLKMTTPSWQQAALEKQIKQLIADEIEVPAGYRIIYEDTQKVINESIMSLVSAVLLSILLIYIVLGVQFNSTRIPFVILVTIPFGFIGVIVSLFVFKSTISLNSMLGIILLSGIVVNNAIIIIDFYLSMKDTFASRTEAVLEAVTLRFRPILITTLTTILGMLPIAFALGDGANIIQPLGIAVSGGLAFSTFFTLFMVPVILNAIPIKTEKQ